MALDTRPLTNGTGTSRKRLGDRRRYERLDVVGTFRGALEIAEPATLVNVSQAGALIATQAVVTANITVPLTLTVEGLEITVPASVRHVSPSAGAVDGDQQHRVGVEFVTPVAVLASVPE